MNFKKIIVNSIFIFLINSIIHFLYTVFPSFLTSIIAPINESIFEHLKMIFTTAIIFSVVTKNDNVFLKSIVRSFCTMIILLIIYLPIRLLIGEVLPITLVILFISIMLSEIITSFIPNKNYNILNYISLFLIILSYISFTYLSYNPPKNYLFYDTLTNTYGI